MGGWEDANVDLSIIHKLYFIASEESGTCEGIDWKLAAFKGRDFVWLENFCRLWAGVSMLDH